MSDDGTIKTLSDFAGGGCLMGEMHEKSDAQLLRDYAQGGDERAFRELVGRHTDFVYSAALRQVDSPDLAADLTQGVFIDLAHKARSLAGTCSGSLAGWLHRSTRYAALNHWRDARRRIAHERQAMEQLVTDADPPPDWERIRPLLDEALDTLGDKDHEALLLRYFKNHDLRTVGRALGVSEDTAQKRVSRAVERLREFFARRGVTISASGLAVLLSAHAVQAAPVGLAVTIATAAALAGTAVSTATVIAATQAIAMTALQKTLLTATLAAAVGAGIYETRQVSRLREANQTLQQQQTELDQQVAQLRRERDAAANRLASLAAAIEQNKRDHDELAKLRAQVAGLRNEKPDAAGSEASSWLQRVTLLKQRLEQTPGAKIPELRLLTDQDWLDVVKNFELKDERDFRQAFSQLRLLAESHVEHQLEPAMKKYSDANQGSFAQDVALLKPYLDPPLEDAILGRYTVYSGDHFKLQMLGHGAEWIITQKGPVDSELDQCMAIGPNVNSSSSFRNFEILETLAPAIKAYQVANHGQMPSEDAAQLAPFITTPAQQAALQKLEELKDKRGH